MSPSSCLLLAREIRLDRHTGSSKHQEYGGILHQVIGWQNLPEMEKLDETDGSEFVHSRAFQRTSLEQGKGLRCRVDRAPELR